MKRYITYIKLLFLLSGIAFLYGFSAKRSQRKVVTDVNITFANGDNLFLTKEMVNKLLIQNTGALKNEPKSLINLHELETLVNSNPLVENAKVFMSIDGVFETIVTQRTPIARVVTSSEGYYIDKNGLKMPLSKNYTARVLLVSGIDGEADLSAVYTLVKKINSNKFLQKLIVGIRKTDSENFILKTRKLNQDIYLGKVEDLQIKFKKLEAFYNEAIKSKELETYNKINLKFSNQVVCTKN